MVQLLLASLGSSDSQGPNTARHLWLIISALDFPPTELFSIPFWLGKLGLFLQAPLGGSDVMRCPQPEGWG